MKKKRGGEEQENNKIRRNRLNAGRPKKVQGGQKKKHRNMFTILGLVKRPVFRGGGEGL